MGRGCRLTAAWEPDKTLIAMCRVRGPAEGIRSGDAGFLRAAGGATLAAASASRVVGANSRLRVALITDFGTHRFDTVHQIMGQDHPKTVAAAGGRFAVSGMGDQPDLLQVTYEYPGFVLSYETCNINSFGSIGRLVPGMPLHGARNPENRPNGMAFYGSDGTLIADRLGYEVIPETGPYGGSLSDRDSFVPGGLRRMHKAGVEPSALHAEHFVRCIRDGEPPRSDAVAGHRSSLVAHLGNIAYKAGRRLVWDADREDFVNDPVASRLLGRRARKPWDAMSL